MSKLSDVGDMNKFLNFETNNKSKFNTRYYNKITEIEHNILKKEVAHPIGVEIIQGEINFYKSIQQYNLSFFPKIYELGETFFTMEKINGDVLKNVNIDEYIELFLETLKQLHDVSKTVVTKNKFINDLKYEFNIKIKTHIENIKPLSNYFRFVQTINNLKIECNDMNFIIDDLYTRVEKELLQINKEEYEYSLIHADSHFCNTMINFDTKKIIFIDPYGRFGESMIYGSEYFDFCLILFSLTGFDNFSSSKNYHFTIENNNIDLHIEIKNLDNYKPFFLKHNINWNVCMYMCILHWIKFTHYTSNHILKSVASYYHGIYLYHKYVL